MSEYRWDLTDTWMTQRTVCDGKFTVNLSILCRIEGYTKTFFFRKRSLRKKYLTLLLFQTRLECTDLYKEISWSCLFKNRPAYSTAQFFNIGLLHSTSSHFSDLTTFFPHLMSNNYNSTVCVCVCDNLLFNLNMVLWVPENALKSSVLYLEMLSLSFSVSSSPRYNCWICELQLLSVTEQKRYILHWCQEAQVNACSVTF